MTLEATLEHVSAIRQALADPAAMIGRNGSLTGGAEAPAATATTTGGESSFASALAQAVSPTSLSSLGTATQGSPGARIVAIAESQLGQTEQPPGSNESPAIAEYRTATAGAVPGAPWCAYFASWVARQAGEPIGEGGQGAGAVSEVWSWAQSTGRAIANGPGVVPQPGDLIVFGDEHVGIVRDVLPNGQIQTIEGNYENKVAANVRSPSEATGYVNMS
ncbi:MAG: CHAP domain-containing protein [Solirubrobacteraceae bacterium]